ncbi:hypothetical protein ILUMI_12363 [Ignelater luminosus]|uniref:AMP-dependent synthetase/ligase domain-containing protein n=1 Tax=Ignelater luminosus TaxID=2038154 RepID=A0A8K0CUA1_IGNLU|nr:hypothetical protein ILUMI_12363 [Ignelater luminosus]
MSGVLLRRLFTINNSARILNSAFLNKWAVRENSSNIIHSALPDIEIPNITIPEYVYKDFNKWPNKIAVECAVTGKKFTYEEVRTKSRNLSRAFRKKLKLDKGDVVSLLLPNVPEFPICVLGALQAGLTVSTINPLYTPGG